MQVANNIANLIGKTPIVKLNRIVDENSADISAKSESFNPGTSVTDRIALSMIDQAEKDAVLKVGDTIIAPTTASSGIGLALVAAAQGYQLVVVMPDTVSMECRNLLLAYGAELHLNPGAEGMKGAIEKATELKDAPGYFMTQQIENEANPEIPALTTGKEIVEQMKDGLDGFVSGIGTGGTITGAGRVLKEHFEDVKLYAVEPVDSPVLSGGSPGPHKIQGIGAGFVPKVLDTDLYDGVIQVTNEESFQAARESASEEGVLVGISSGAAIAAAKKVAEELGKGKKVLAILPDSGERYLSTALFQFDE